MGDDYIADYCMDCKRETELEKLRDKTPDILNGVAVHHEQWVCEHCLSDNALTTAKFDEHGELLEVLA